MKTKFLAVAGPSAVGKNTVMNELRRIDQRFVLIKAHVTRALRPGETDKVSMSLPELMAMRRLGEAIQVNYVYGIYTTLPKNPILNAFASGMFPMSDYNLSFVKDLKTELSGSLFCVYLLPPNFDILRKRMEKSRGAVDEARIEEDKRQVKGLEKYLDVIDFKIVNEEGKISEVTEEIRTAYLCSIRS